MALSLAVNGVVAGFLVREMGRGSATGPNAVSAGALGTVRHGLCGKRRCSLPEDQHPRREPEPDPVGDLVMEAEILPALGMAEQDPRKLPKLQAYQQKEIVEDGVNLEKDNEPPERKLKKAFDPREAKKLKDAKLEDLLDHVDEDPRKTPTRIEDFVGRADGEIGGVGTIKRPGSVYVRQVQRELEKNFRVPTYISPGELEDLVAHVKVTRMGPDGAVLAYRVVRKSGNRGFDDAVVALLRQYMPDEKGRERLPLPDDDVMRYINAKGMRIQLVGARLK